MTKETTWINIPDVGRPGSNGWRPTRRSVMVCAGGILLSGGLAQAGQSGSGVARSQTQFSLPSHSGVAVSDSLPAPDWSALEAGPEVRIQAVVDGDTVELERGPDVRFVGIQAPKLPLGRDHVEEWPLAQEAKRHLEDLIRDGGADARLFFGGRRGDRHGRHLAHVVLADGTWLQGAMVLAGLARVYTFVDNRSLIPELLLREEIARRSERLVWSHPYYAVRDARHPRDLLALTHHFELVEGTVLHVAAYRTRWYLNFGETWREDFTITIDREHDPVFEDSGVDLHALQGIPVRVRGWLLDDGGPMIRVDHPEAIERLTGQTL